MARFHDVSKSLLIEVAGAERTGSMGDVSLAKADKGSDPDLKDRDAEMPGNGMPAGEGRRTPKPNEPDPQEVQYPGYFKDGGSL